MKKLHIYFKMVDNYLIEPETISIIMIMGQLSAIKEHVHFASVLSTALHHILSQILMGCQLAVGAFRLHSARFPASPLSSLNLLVVN